nr:hypothetical protein [Tanacetum cinerariifolium]
GSYVLANEEVKPQEPVEIIDREVKQLKQIQIPLVKVDGTPSEVLSLRGNSRINSGRNTHISSQRPHRRQVSRLKPLGQVSSNGGRL